MKWRTSLWLLAATLCSATAFAQNQASGARPMEPASEIELDQALREAVRWMVEHQNENGSWGSHHSPRPIEVLADIPGSHEAFRVATTALGVMALQDSPFTSEASRQAMSRAVDYLIDNWNVKRPDGVEHYNVWAFGYSLQALGEWLTAHPEDARRARILEVGAALVEKLERYQDLDGGWGYLSLQSVRTYQPSFTSMSFTTATILLGLDRMRAAGLELPPKMVAKAVRQVASCRTPRGSFSYGKLWNRNPMSGLSQDKGAACRTPLCLNALALFGHEIETKAYRKSLEDLLIEHTRMQRLSLRRPIPHESWYQISGYFYLYGHAYAAYVLESMPDSDQARYWPKLVEAVMVCHQPDGSFWDYPLYSYHKPYGTAFALIALSRAYRGLQTSS